MNEILALTLCVLALVAILTVIFINFYRLPLTVSEGFGGLLYRDGQLVETLPPGRHIRWGRRWKLVILDLRQASLTVPGQEVLTSDNASIKASLIVRYQINDPAKLVREAQNWLGDLYNIAQIAMREIVGGVAIEGLLGQRLDLGAQLLARIQRDTAKTGIAVHAAEIRDITLAADLKRAFADVLKAKQEGQAALERARGEAAALRNLANAARLLDGNPALQNLRLLQSLGAAQKAGSTLVFGMPGGFAPLKQDSAPGQGASEAV